MMKRLLTGVVVLALGFSTTVFAGQAQNARDQERAERDRQKAAEREQREARENQEIIDNSQDEIDALALQLLQTKYDDPFLQEYVNELGQSLVPKETPSGVLFSFRVISNRVPNALALPDGRIFVTTGLLTFVNNEAQLAFVLGHEIGHVIELHYARAVREARTRQKVGAVAGVVAGAILGGLSKGKEGAVTGAAVGAVAGYVIAAVTMNSYSRQQEDEADRRGAMLALDRRFDPKEGSLLFKRLADTFGDQDKFSNALWGRHSRNVERIENIDRLLASDLAPRYNPLRTSGDLTLGSAQMQLYTSAMIRDVAIGYMDDDRFDLAKALLEQIATYRARDPQTAWALGKVYKTVGRTEADRSKALDLLQRAVRLDERNRFPHIRRDYGLMQARIGNTAGAVESLKEYILNYQRLSFHDPDDLDKMYDYLLTFGDSKWEAPRIDTRVVRAAGESDVRPVPPPTPVSAPAPVQTVAPASRTPANGGRPAPRPQPTRPQTQGQ
jgi:predicted Zn-dependent protease